MRMSEAGPQLDGPFELCLSLFITQPLISNTQIVVCTGVCRICLNCLLEFRCGFCQLAHLPQLGARAIVDARVVGLCLPQCLRGCDGLCVTFISTRNLSGQLNTVNVEIGQNLINRLSSNMATLG